MKSCHLLRAGYGRLVGDPIDVVTGANLDVQLDFRLAGPLPLEWRRYYHSALHRQAFPLGWGQTHEYDRRLEFDVDGVRYVAPAGLVVGFAPLTADGAQTQSQGVHLRRLAAGLFEVLERGQPRMEFTFPAGQTVARLTAVTRGAAALTFAYDARGALARITDSQGRAIWVETDARGRVTGLILAGGAAGRDRALITYRYDAAGNLVEGIDAYQHTFRNQFDPQNRLTCKTDRRGYAFHYRYDEAGRCLHVRGDDGALDLRFRYFPLERRTVLTRFDGGEWSYFYNEDQALTLIIDPYGGTTKFTFDDRGRPAEEIDPNGNASQLVYDAGGGLIGKRSPLGHFQAIPEDPLAPDPSAPRIASCPLEWEFGDLLPRHTITPPEPGAAVFRDLPHEAVKYLRTAAPAQGPARVVTDDLGLVTQEVGPDGRARRWSYDPNGNVARYHDRDGSTWAYEYTTWNRLGKVTDPLGNQTTCRYSPGLKLATLTDPGGTTSEYRYDQKDRLVEVRRHGVVKETYAYDPADNLIEKRDGRGNLLLRMEYGPGNLKALRRLGDGETQRFTYNERGRCLAAVTEAMAVAFAYDDQGRRISDQRDGLGVAHHYDRAGLARTTWFGRFTAHYRHAGPGTVVLRDPTGKEHRIRILDHGLVERRLASGTVEVSQFDASGRCLMKSAWRIGAAEGPWNRVYSYSAEGYLEKGEDNRHGARSYAYDAAHRLIGAAAPGRQEQYAYDPAGNLVAQAGRPRLSLRDGNRLGAAAAGGNRFEYDHRNRLAVWETPAGAVRYHYDARDQLIRADLPGGRVWTARYDPLGRRVEKTCGGQTTRYYWDADRLAAEIGPGGEVRLYLYPDPGALVPAVVVDFAGLDQAPAAGRILLPFYDQVGAPVRVEDAEGRAVWAAQLTPYGDLLPHAAADLAFNLRFPGHYWDGETGLHYNRYRYYSPALGRYLQEDPLGTGGGTNLYAYPPAPVCQVDVLGLNAAGCDGTAPKPAAPEGGPEREIPEGGLSVEERIKQGGKPPPHVEAQPEKYFYDPESGQYKRRPEPKPDLSSGNRAIPCFPAGTPVWTCGGPAAIEAVVAGALVPTAAAPGRAPLRRPVTAVLRGKAIRLVLIQAAGETVRATPSHRFWVEGASRWAAAYQLEPGMALGTAAAPVTVAAVQTVDLPEIDTYNLTVAEGHTYFIGATGFLVHNEDETPNGKIYVGYDKDDNPIYVGQTKQDIDDRQYQHNQEGKTDPDKAWKEDMTIKQVPGMDGLTDDQMDYHERRVYDQLKEEGHDLKNAQIPMTDEKINALVEKHCQ